MDNSIGNDRTMTGPTHGKPASLSPGTMLGQYRIVRLLGRGGMGEVYEAEHTTLARRFALKLLPVDFAARSGALDRFRREAQVMANLDHPNIVRVDDFGETDGRYWLRMELVEGQSLQQFLAAFDGKIPQRWLLGILRQVCAGLTYAHGHGAVHRDIKPANILVRRDECATAENEIAAKIADFGLVRVMGEDWVRSQVQLSVQRSLSMGDRHTAAKDAVDGTSTRSLLGTYEYMSPEQKNGIDADERSDIYALGIMTFRLLTGQGLGLKLPSRIDPSLARAWDTLVERCLESDPSVRPQTMRHVCDLLAGVERELFKAAPLREDDHFPGRAADIARDVAAESTQEKEPRSGGAEPNKGALIPTGALGEELTLGLGGDVDLELVWTPAGVFMMGSPVSERKACFEEHQHPVRLTKGFWIGKYPVTQKQWQHVTGNNPASFHNKQTVGGFLGFGGRQLSGVESMPINNVTWQDCQQFLDRVSQDIDGICRLPSEAEWEYACRAGSTTAYCYGDDEKRLKQYANFDGTPIYGRESASPVGCLTPNDWGIHDMHGNVYEWCLDWYAPYPTGAVDDPMGPVSGSHRVLRGGCWDTHAGNCRSASRMSADPCTKNAFTGFRVVIVPG